VTEPTVATKATNLPSAEIDGLLAPPANADPVLSRETVDVEGSSAAVRPETRGPHPFRVLLPPGALP